MRITAGKRRMVVVPDGQYVAGTVSDGDIRKSFLTDVLPIAPIEKIMNTNFVTTTENDPQQFMEIIHGGKATVFPIVSKTNEFFDVALACETSWPTSR